MKILTENDFIDVLKRLYPASYVNSMLNGIGGWYLKVYAALFAAVMNVLSETDSELYIDSADGGFLDILVYGERGMQRAYGETDAQFQARAQQKPLTVSPANIIEAVNKVLQSFGEPMNAVLLDGYTYQGAAFDTLQTIPDPFNNDALIPLAADDAGIRNWRNAFFVVRVPIYYTTQASLAFDTLLSMDIGAIGVTPLSADDAGAPPDLQAEVYNSAMYSAIWNTINRAKAAGVGFFLEGY